MTQTKTTLSWWHTLLAILSLLGAAASQYLSAGYATKADLATTNGDVKVLNANQVSSERRLDQIQATVYATDAKVTDIHKLLISWRAP